MVYLSIILEVCKFGASLVAEVREGSFKQERQTLLHCRHVHYRRLDIDDMVIIITRKLGRYETLFFHTPLPLSTTLVSTISTLLVSMQKCQHKLLAHRQMVKCWQHISTTKER